MPIRWARWIILIVPLVLGIPAEAADVVFPPGSRIGLVPPAGMTVSKAFQGFEDREKNASMILVELSGDAYGEIEKNFSVDGLKAQGVEVKAREELPPGESRGFMIVAHQTMAGIGIRKWALVATQHDITAVISVQVPDAEQDAYPDSAMRASLATFTTRPEVPAAEQLGLLPFSIGDLAGFRIVRAAATGAALLTDGPKDAIELNEQALVLITLLPVTSDQVSDRDSIARRTISATPGVKEMHVVRAEDMRIGGLPGHEILVDGKEAKTDTDVRAVQWLRFGPGGSMRLLGVVRKDAWDAMYPRLRAVRDSIQSK